MIFFLKNKILLIFALIFLLTVKISFSQEINLDYKQNLSIYDKPYSFFENNINFNQIKKNTYLVLGASIIGAGILYLMPESVTNWNKDDLKTGKVFKRWKNNVKEGPVIDKDDWFLNWITHPYWGAAYYMSARSSGANAFYSFLFSTLASTFFWEYGIEAFAEVPSKQDLIITPVIGSIIGEGFYLAKRHIYENDYKLLDSKILGVTTAFLMDPITEVWKLFSKDKTNKNNIQSFVIPNYNSQNGFSYNIYLTANF